MALLKKKNKTTKAGAEPRTSVIQHILHGNVITTDFFVKHWIKVFLVTVIIMISISTKYQCMTSMEEIQRLHQTLNISRTECVRERSEYMSRIRESAMSELVDSLLPGLTSSDQPPYVIETTYKVNNPNTTATEK